MVENIQLLIELTINYGTVVTLHKDMSTVLMMIIQGRRVPLTLVNRRQVKRILRQRV